jgi:polysaccharide deacetylase
MLESPQDVLSSHRGRGTRMSVPLGERGGALRGALDLVCGRLPRFVFGGGIGPLVPVFHFHDERRDVLTPRLRYLRENGYRTLRADELAAVARRRRPPGDREVALCFDDAWTTVWTDAAPLLREFGLTAIVYAIPGRMTQGDSCRPVGSDGEADGPPFMTWTELGQLQGEGIIDVQSHTWAHAMVFTSPGAIDFVRPGYERGPLLNRPLLSQAPALQFVDPLELGAPLYEQRSRMSDGPRICLSREAHQASVDTVRAAGGAAFFKRADWRQTLERITAQRPGATTESESDHQRAIEDELDRSRSELNARLRTQSVRHVCLPWGVSGVRTAAALERLGFDSAIANRWSGHFAVGPGDHPFWLKRLPNRYIFHLPGRGRASFFRPGRPQ